jgi:hypothetical protein
MFSYVTQTNNVHLLYLDRFFHLLCLDKSYSPTLDKSRSAALHRQIVLALLPTADHYWKAKQRLWYLNPILKPDSSILWMYYNVLNDVCGPSVEQASKMFSKKKLQIFWNELFRIIHGTPMGMPIDTSHEENGIGTVNPYVDCLVHTLHTKSQFSEKIQSLLWQT